MNGDVPLATTLKLTELPAVTVCEAGCVVIVGATVAAFTVKVAASDVVDPAELVTTAE